MTAYISRFMVRYITLVIAALFCTGNALALKLEVVLDESEIPSCGAIVGYLEFENDGPAPIRIGGALPYLTIEVEGPDGTHISLNPNSHRGRPQSRQIAQLDQGEWVRHPLCLLIHQNGHIFEKVGRYRVRAKYRELAIQHIALDDSTVLETIPGNRGDSNWVEVNVSAPLRGRPQYVNSHSWYDLIGAFRDDMTDVRAHLGDVQDYRREQEKLLVYQESGGALSALVRDRVRDEQALGNAHANLLRAQRVGVGVEMWEWIVAQLEALPADSGSSVEHNSKNGYMF